MKLKKWIIYALGVLSGIILTFIFAYCLGRFYSSGISGLELYDKPGNYQEYTQFEVLQVVESGCALAEPKPETNFGMVVLLIPNQSQHFYDNQIISLNRNQRSQRVGTYKYITGMGLERTVQAVRIVNTEP